MYFTLGRFADSLIIFDWIINSLTPFNRSHLLHTHIHLCTFAPSGFWSPWNGKSSAQEVRDDPNIILMIDEIHTLVGAGGGGDGGAMDAANILKPALARGDMQIIGGFELQL